VTDERWRSFLTVDVLQLIGVSLVVLQLLVLLMRTPRAFGMAAFVSFAGVLVATPFVWAVDWTGGLPLWVAAYLSPAATASPFPLIPWIAYVLMGAGLGQVYSHWGAGHLAAFANRFLLAGGGAMLAAGLLPFAPLGASPHSAGNPNDILIRAGSVLLTLGLIAHFSRRLSRLPHVFGAMAQESLLVYFVHLMIVYGSVWNFGLQFFVGPGLSLVPGYVVVILLVSSMAALAWAWNWLKHAHPRVARVISYVALSYLAAVLIF
jgi:uncharacterized membrane protein